MTKTNVNEIKVPCLQLNKILTIRKLNSKQLKGLINKLKKFVKNSKPGNIDVLKYVRLVVLEILTLEEKRAVNKLVSQFDRTKMEGITAIQNILAAIYITIADTYPELRIELICGDLNGLHEIISNQPEDPNKEVDDEQFHEHLNKETKSLKKLKKQFRKDGIFCLKDIQDLEKYLKQNIVAQDEAISVICDALKLKVAGFTNVVNLFFIGKTGVGKTQLSRLLGDKYSNNFWQVDCAEFSHGHEMNKLLGAPPGYVGHSGSSMLKEKANVSNKWVILFDEIEKAHEKFFNFLLGLMENGVCQDISGNKIDLSESIFIFTSNCGTKDLKNTTTNFHKLEINSSSTREDLLKSLEHQFSPEFRNRIDEFVFFNDLNKENARNIVKLNLKTIPVRVTDELVDFIVTHGFSEEFGARSIRRCVKKNLLVLLSEVILSNDGETYKGNYEVSIENDKLKISKALTNT